MSANFSWVWKRKFQTTAFSAGVERCGLKTFNILSKHWGLRHVPLPPFIFISSFIQCSLFYALVMLKEFVHLIIPAAFIAYLFTEALTYLCEPCAVLNELLII